MVFQTKCHEKTHNICIDMQPQYLVHQSPSPIQNKVTLQIKPTHLLLPSAESPCSPSDCHKTGVIGRKRKGEAVNQQGQGSKPQDCTVESFHALTQGDKTKKVTEPLFQNYSLKT